MMQKVKNTINYEIVFREIKENKHKWRQSLCSWVGSVNIVKISVSSNGSIVSVQCQLIPQQAFL